MQREMPQTINPISTLQYTFPFILKLEPKTKTEEADIGYLAGIIESEGNISIIKGIAKTRNNSIQLSPIIGIVNSNYKLIEQIVNILSSSNIHYRTYYRERTNKKHKNAWEIHIKRPDNIINLLNIIMNYLIAKKSQAEILKEFCVRAYSRKLYHGQQRYEMEDYKLYDQLREINRKGQRKDAEIIPYDIECNEKNLSWLSGIIDGDGRISMYYHRQKQRNPCLVPVVAIDNTNKDLITHCCSLLNALCVHYFLGHSDRSAKWALALRIEIRQFSNILRLLNATMPYLIAKKEQGLLLHDFCSSYDRRKHGYSLEDWNIYRKLKQLNQKGKVSEDENEKV